MKRVLYLVRHEQMFYKNSIKVIFGIIASVFFVYMVLRSVSFESLIQALRNTQISWLSVGLLCLLGAYLLRIKRSQTMLASVNPTMTFARSAIPYMISIAANNVLPLRAGDALRAINFSSWLRVPTASILAVMLVERLMDFLVIISSFGVALFLFHPRSDTGDIVLHFSSTMLLLGAVGVVVLLVFPAVLRLPVMWLLSFLSRFVPSFVKKIRPHVDKMFHTLTVMAHRPRMALLFGYTGLSWLLEACTFYAVARSIPAVTNPAAAWLAMPVGTLATILPSSPGYVGTFHYFVIVATRALGNSAASSTAFAVLIHLVLWLPITVCGMACFFYWIFERHKTASIVSENSIDRVS